MPVIVNEANVSKAESRDLTDDSLSVQRAPPAL
ncbi:hypothetical protein R69658_06932 [Paraburkholderia aspalathi]|uniref:Uncharacterized protein n=1 Tax=Paraburkholderia aspalathi TaxID=1324617 RepID=A0ABM8SZX7_9BURK|nr:hypothetical protein R69658_06932 [Paraburkholderia aspalathi]